jgi:hypothetical protein
MASDREKAKDAITKTDSNDPDLNAALADAASQQHRITVENNRHKEALHNSDLGRMGRWFGGEKSAPIAIAGIAAFAGLFGALFSLWMASRSLTPDSADFWSKMMERCMAFAASCLTFIFGRTGKR